MREDYYEIIDIKNCPKCGSEEIKCHGATENGLNDLYHCEKCEKWFENDDPNYT
jgi:predicted RNA-binding Zn-ribbon protein involved in translation (DUF1610 family)